MNKDTFSIQVRNLVSLLDAAVHPENRHDSSYGANLDRIEALLREMLGKPPIETPEAPGRKHRYTKEQLESLLVDRLHPSTLANIVKNLEREEVHQAHAVRAILELVNLRSENAKLRAALEQAVLEPGHFTNRTYGWTYDQIKAHNRRVKAALGKEE